MHFVKGHPQADSWKEAESSQFSDTITLLAHCSNHSTNMEISFCNEGVFSFTSYCTKIVIHLVTFQTSSTVSGKDHPPS